MNQRKLMMCLMIDTLEIKVKVVNTLDTKIKVVKIHQLNNVLKGLDHIRVK